MGGLWSILGFLHSLRRLCFLQKVSEAMNVIDAIINLYWIYTESIPRSQDTSTIFVTFRTCCSNSLNANNICKRRPHTGRHLQQALLSDVKKHHVDRSFLRRLFRFFKIGNPERRPRSTKFSLQMAILHSAFETRDVPAIAGNHWLMIKHD
jgi:hypothetical protein